MDPYKLLTRSTKLPRKPNMRREQITPSSGQATKPQKSKTESNLPALGKRKRGQDAPTETSLDFFGSKVATHDSKSVNRAGDDESHGSVTTSTSDHRGRGVHQVAVEKSLPSAEESRRILRENKVKLTLLNVPVDSKKRKKKDKKKAETSRKRQHASVLVRPLSNFTELQSRYSVSSGLARNVSEEGYVTPTQVQLAALPVLMSAASEVLPVADEASSLPETAEPDLLSIAPTGSGKTLAFMIPLIHRLVQRKRSPRIEESGPFAIILAPTKELVSQIVNEGRKLAKNTGIRVTQVRKGMTLAASSPNITIEKELSDDEQTTSRASVVKADILVSTPGTLKVIFESSHDAETLSHIRFLILDEADVLLDPLFREQALAIWRSLTHEDLRVSLWSATMGSNIEELAQSVIHERIEKLRSLHGREVREAPLIRLVVGLKDSAVPNVRHRLIYAASEQGKLMGLRQLLHPTTNDAEDGPPLIPPFLVFAQTIERAIALHSELRYDIPAEAGGISRIAVLHSDLSDTARDNIMKGFRKSEIWILITTDLLSRGVDFRGVNGVVNYDIPTSSAAYVHRVGRTGRAGREGGVAVTLYSKEDIPYLKPIANLVAAAERQGNGESDVQKWLLDSLPTLSKNAKQNLKKHGVESRTARGMQKDPKAARKARISTKSGFVRREENKRKGAILGSQRRQEAASEEEDGDDVGFDGFD